MLRMCNGKRLGNDEPLISTIYYMLNFISNIKINKMTNLLELINKLIKIIITIFANGLFESTHTHNIYCYTHHTTLYFNIHMVTLQIALKRCLKDYYLFNL